MPGRPRAAVVTGAAGGIGSAVSAALAAAGLAVACPAPDGASYLQGMVVMTDGGVTA
jgi:nucleoside-diphosphate-sugar epimerase